MGATRASTRRKNGYWTKQKNRTAINISNRLVRHIDANPEDKVAARALNNLRNG
jgi:hypothetical protein